MKSPLDTRASLDVGARVWHKMERPDAALATQRRDFNHEPSGRPAIAGLVMNSSDEEGKNLPSVSLACEADRAEGDPRPFDVLPGADLGTLPFQMLPEKGRLRPTLDWGFGEHPEGARVCGPPPRTWFDTRPNFRPARCCANCAMATEPGRIGPLRCHHRQFPNDVIPCHVCDAFTPRPWMESKFKEGK